MAKVIKAANIAANIARLTPRSLRSPIVRLNYFFD